MRWIYGLLVLVSIEPAIAQAPDGLYQLRKGVRVDIDPPELASDVQDPIFALFAALLDAEAYGSLSPAILDSVARTHGGSKLPYEVLRRLEREAPIGNQSGLRLTFADDLKVSIPYSILGYHPGSLRTSRELVFHEWKLHRFALRWRDGEEVQLLEFEDLRLFALRSGRIQMDVDWWIDKLMGSGIDDTDLVGFAIVNYEGHRLAVAFGYNNSGSGRSGVFDLSADEIRFPAPPELLRLGRELRAKAEELLQEFEPSD